MREWSERHIRDLVEKEYKRLNGGAGNVKYNNLRSVVRNYIEYTLMRDNITSLLSGYRIACYGVEGIAISEARTDLLFLIDSVNVELFQVPELTDEQESQVTSAYGASFLASYLDMQNQYFYKAHIGGSFKHNYLSTTEPNLRGFYFMPIVTVKTNFDGYYPQVDNVNEDLPYITDENANAWNGYDWHFGVRPIPMALPLDAVLPTKNPLTGVDEYGATTIQRYLTDRNNTSRHLLFEYTKGTGHFNEVYTVSWLSGGPYQDYANKTLEFEFDTFIGRQVDYGIYKKVADLLGL